MKHYKTLSKLQKGILSITLSLLLVFGVVNTASARPMFGSGKKCNESTCWAGYKMCETTTYFFWIGFKSGWEPEVCLN